jgi:imidazolonepropionase-like amidohydrolase
MMKTVLASAVLLIVAAHSHAANQTTKYKIYVDNGKQAGEQIVERDETGLTKVKFIFKDNGRGPELTEQYRLASDGSLSEYSVKGSSTFGAIVDEKFSRKDSLAQWQSTSEKGSKNLTGTALYVPLNSSFEMASVAISALAGQGETEIPLLPSGTLAHKKIAEMEVVRGSEKQMVHLISQTGIGLSPSYIWATSATKEAKPRLFAVIMPGAMRMIEEGWEANADAMSAIQVKEEREAITKFAQQLQKPLHGLTVVRNARIFNSDTAKVGVLSDVYVLRGRISAIVPAGSPIRGAVQELDAAGRILLPGLFDMHGHVGRWEGGLNIAAGVTTVRDMGNDNEQMQMMLDETAQGKLLGPQVVPSGFLEGESPFSANNGFVVKDIAGAKNAIDWYAQHGYPQLKIYNSFPKEILKETVAYAHTRGLRVSGHIPVGLRAFEALDMGYDEIQHINQVMLNFLATPKTDTRTLDRFILPSEKTTEIDFKSKAVKDFIATLKAKKISIDPTLATFAFLKQKDGDMNEPFVAIADHMPPDIKRGFSMGTMKIADEATLKRYEKSYAKMVEFVGILYKAGVPIVAGTDEIAGFTLQSELELLVKAGLTPAQALQVATKNGAIYTRTQHERGSIEVGKLADLVLVDGDPTKNIADVRKVSAVITRGFLMYPHQIHQTMGIKPFVQNPPELKALKPVSSSNALAGNEGARLRFIGKAKHD